MLDVRIDPQVIFVKYSPEAFNKLLSLLNINEDANSNLSNKPSKEEVPIWIGNAPSSPKQNKTTIFNVRVSQARLVVQIPRKDSPKYVEKLSNLNHADLVPLW